MPVRFPDSPRGAPAAAWAAPLALAAIAAVTSCPAARAQGGGTPEKTPIVTDRPDFTESTEVVPLRRVQLEGGVTYSRTSDEKGYTLGEFLLRVNTGPRTELRVGVNSYALVRSPGGNAYGWEDPTLGMKVKLADGDERPGLRRPDIGLILQTTLPVGAPAYREETLQPEAKLCLAWDLCERVQMSSNLNYAWVSEESERFGQFSGTLSFAYALSDRVGSYLEYFGFFPGEEAGGNRSYVNGGFTYLVTDDFQLDARAGFGMNPTRPDGFFGVGASRRW